MSLLAHLEMLYLDIEYWTDVWKSTLRVYGEDCLEQFSATGGENGEDTSSVGESEQELGVV